MATIDQAQVNRPIQGGTWGNASIESVPFVPLANLVAGDDVQIFEMETGIRLHDAQVFVKNNLASGTLSLGFRMVDRTQSALDNLTYFINAVSIATAGRFRATGNNPPFTLPSAAYLVATIGGAAFPTSNQLDVQLSYDFRGKL